MDAAPPPEPTGANHGGGTSPSHAAQARKTEGFAPSDYSDNRSLGEWQSIYPAEAWQIIRGEGIYLGVVLALSLGGACWVIFAALATDPTLKEVVQGGNGLNRGTVLLSLAAASIGGVVGGCTFALKWMYHSVAKKLWHEDRLLWRVLTPWLCGVVATATTLLISTNLLRVFDAHFLERPVTVLAFNFLVGYFSDKALAKLAEVADTLFGSAKGGLRTRGS